MNVIMKYLKVFLVVVLAFSISVVSFTGCTSDSSETQLNESSLSEVDDKTSEEFISSLESYESSDSSESSEIEESDDSVDSSDASFSSESYESLDISDESKIPDISVEPKDPFDPITPIPKHLYPDEIDSFFDNSVFIGYSIMMHFGKYVSQWKIEVDESIMGESTFCCGVGMNFINNRTQTPDKKDNVLPKYMGESYNFEDLPVATGSNSMYIGLMPFSEFKYCSVENCVEEATEETIKGIENIRKKNPELRIVILSGTYNTGEYATGELDPERENNKNVRLFNINILEYCNNNGIDFIDVSTPLLDGRGFMPVKYASDRDYHIKKNTFKIWINIFRDYAEAKQNGTWKNIETMPPLVN